VTPRPDLRGRLRSASELGQLALFGPRVIRWLILAGGLAAMAVAAALAAAVRLPFPAIAAAASAAFTVATLALFAARLSTDDVAIATWWIRLSRVEWSRFRRLNRGARPIRTRRSMRAYVRREAGRSEVAEYRALYRLFLGQDPTADLGAIPDEDPMSRFQRLRLEAAAAFEAGGFGDLGATRAAIASIDDGADRRLAGWQVALEDARQRLVTTGDWRSPLRDAAAREPAPGGRPTVVRVQLPIVASAGLLLFLASLAGRALLDLVVT
jgi:hypothetical protein